MMRQKLSIFTMGSRQGKTDGYESYPVQRKFLFSYPVDAYFVMNPSTIKNLRQLANFLRCEEEFLAAFFAGDVVVDDPHKPHPLPPLTDRTTVIQKLYLRKKDRRVRGYREIYSIQTDTLKSVLKGLNTYIQACFKTSQAVHGYVAGRNIRTNAEQHLAKQHLLSVDIYKFFESISLPMIEQAFIDVGFPPFAAIHLAQLVTVTGFLPPGFPTSPTLSNLIVQDMDKKFADLCGTDCTYTRYADDLYFSSNCALPALGEIEQIIIAKGFSLNADKTKSMPRGSKQYVTGLTVFDHVRPHVSRVIKRKLRQELHYMKAYGLKSHALHIASYSQEDYDQDPLVQGETQTAMRYILMKVEGWIHFMKSVERPAAVKLEAIWKQVKP
jgi:RNA-directed DNA polymerase